MDTKPEPMGKADQLRARIKALRAEVRAMEAKEARKAKDLAKKEHARRCYMIGEIYVNRAAKDPEFRARLIPAIDNAYDGDADRALWGLPPRSKKPAAHDGA